MWTQIKVAALSGLVTSVSVAKVPIEINTKTLDPIIESAHQAQGFSGVVMATDAKTVTYERAIGFADIKKKTPHNVTASWRWASVSKQVTAIVVAQLIDEGKLALTDVMSKHLSEKQFPNANRERITVAQLLQHTGGLANPSDGDGKTMSAFYTQSKSAETIHADSTAKECASSPKRAPNERFEYNNCDYLVLGAIIEAIEKKPVSQVISERIAQPAGLKHLLLARSNADDSPIVGYEKDATVEKPQQLSNYGAAGALVGSPHDLMRMNQAMLNGKLLPMSQRNTFWQGDPKWGYAGYGLWAFPAALKGCKEDVPLVERRGHIGGIQVRNVLAPSLNKAVVIFTNRGDFDFGEIWQGKGFAFDVLSEAFCR